MIGFHYFKNYSKRFLNSNLVWGMSSLDFVPVAFHPQRDVPQLGHLTTCG